jgi:hypothetical protein
VSDTNRFAWPWDAELFGYPHSKDFHGGFAFCCADPATVTDIPAAPFSYIPQKAAGAMYEGAPTFPAAQPSVLYAFGGVDDVGRETAEIVTLTSPVSSLQPPVWDRVFAVNPEEGPSPRQLAAAAYIPLCSTRTYPPQGLSALPPSPAPPARAPTPPPSQCFVVFGGMGPGGTRLNDFGVLDISKLACDNSIVSALSLCNPICSYADDTALATESTHPGCAVRTPLPLHGYRSVLHIPCVIVVAQE